MNMGKPDYAELERRLAACEKRLSYIERFMATLAPITIRREKD